MYIHIYMYIYVYSHSFICIYTHMRAGHGSPTLPRVAYPPLADGVMNTKEYEELCTYICIHIYEYIYIFIYTYMY